MPQEVAVLDVDYHEAIALRSGKVHALVVALDVRLCRVALLINLRGIIPAYCREELLVRGLPRHGSVFLQAGEEFAGTVKKDAPVLHADSATVEIVLFAMGPQGSACFQVDGQYCPAEAEVGFRIGVIVSLPHVPGPAAHAGPIRTDGLHGGLFSADQRVEDTVFDSHPLPDGAVGDAFGENDLVLDLARARVD